MRYGTTALAAHVAVKSLWMGRSSFHFAGRFGPRMMEAFYRELNHQMPWDDTSALSWRGHEQR